MRQAQSKSTQTAPTKATPARRPSARTSHKPIIGIHLDLKGTMFRPSYIPQLLADLAGQGVNTVLVEYEDIFPFKGHDLAYDKSVRWSRPNLRKFLAAAAAHGIEVIPLQQCLGHLEYVFRWEQYRKFALDKKYPSTVDTTQVAACRLIFDLLEQVIAAHPDSRYVHLGMDEAHALVEFAKVEGRDVLEIYCALLDELCAICERQGKTPIIWSDMFEDHINPATLPLLAKYKDRLILNIWDYGSTGERIVTGRIAGNRVSRQWLSDRENPQAPAIGAETLYVEELPPPILKLVKPHLKGPYFTTMFQADLWSGLGFKVLGASAVRSSADGAVLPFYNHHRENIRAWSRAALRTGALGHIGTSWARGTTWCPPNYNTDVGWPLVAELASSMGAKPRPFFEGIPQATQDRIFSTLGRCRADWRIEDSVADEMESLEPQLKSHHYEWRATILMARTLAIHRRADYVLSEVTYFHANTRPVPSEWQRRLDDQAKSRAEIDVMRAAVRAHFARRHAGDAFEEWLRDMFELYVTRLQDASRISRAKQKIARRTYAR